MKLNPLPSPMREKQRYIAFELISKKEFDLSLVVAAIWNSVMQLSGELGTSKAFLWIPSNLYDKKKKRGVIRCNHSALEEVRAAVSSIRQIQNEPLVLHVLGVTGTIKSAKRKYLGIIETSLSDFSSGKEK